MLKDPENPHLIKNYRPLSLLNCDYKIITKTLSMRTSKIMPIVIDSDQASSVKGRKIADHNHYIRDIIKYAQDTQAQNCIMSLDQMKAFDRVDHSWLHAQLRHMNFGPYYRSWIKTLYSAPRACVLVNGALSGNFPITRSVRQGDKIVQSIFTLTS